MSPLWVALTHNGANTIKAINNADLRNISSLRRHRLVLALMISLRFSRDARRIFTVPTRDARRIRTHLGRRNHSFERQVTQRISFDKLSDLLDSHVRRDQL